LRKVPVFVEAKAIAATFKVLVDTISNSHADIWNPQKGVFVFDVKWFL
jgi:hypothetical protein